MLNITVVVKDICSLTGLAIIADISKGNLDPEKLSKHRNGNCKKSQEEIAKALKGNKRIDFFWLEAGVRELFIFSEKDSSMRYTNQCIS